MEDKIDYIRYPEIEPAYRQAGADDTDGADENGYLLRKFFATEARKHRDELEKFLRNPTGEDF